MKYKVYEVDRKPFGADKEMKSLVIQGEHSQYPTKNVAMWSDHPLYDTIEAGQEHEFEIDEKDSTVENKHKPGTYYKNRSILKPGQVSENQVQGMRDNTNTAQRLDGVVASLKRIEEHLGTTPKPDLPEEVVEAQEITPDDIPF